MTVNWIIVPVRNNLHLTREAVRTFRAQDVDGGVTILLIDNGSTDGTAEWVATQPDIFCAHNAGYGLSVAASWNLALQFVFDSMRAGHALVVNNDVELRPDTYRRLLSDGGGFVTAVGTRDPEKIRPNSRLGVSHYDDLDTGAPNGYRAPDPAHKRPHPDFSCFLIRRDVYQLVGPFDEGFKVAFCEDWDYHLRLHRAGIRAEALELPFLHHASQTVKNCDDAERDRIMRQAGANRDYFYQKWNVRGGTDEYYALFGNTPPPADEEPTATTGGEQHAE